MHLLVNLAALFLSVDINNIISSESISPSVPVTATEGVSIGPVIMGVVSGIGVSILFIGAVLIVAIIWRFNLHRVKNKCKEFLITY